MRIGALRYLNALPLIQGLDRDEKLEVVFEIPSLLAEDLHSGNLDLALIPQVELVRDSSYRIVPGPCVSCRGAVDSILLFSTRKWSDIRRIGVDLSSRSSVELLRVLFHLRKLPPPTLIPVAPRLDALRDPHPELDAILLIGDRALAEDHGEFPRFDLGALWFEATELPFVFAVWVGREGVSPYAIRAVQAAARLGLDSRPQLADAFSREHPDVLDARGALRYLTGSIHYELGSLEIESMMTFCQLRQELPDANLTDLDTWKPQFFESFD